MSSLENYSIFLAGIIALLILIINQPRQQQA